MDIRKINGFLARVEDSIADGTVDLKQELELFHDMYNISVQDNYPSAFITRAAKDLKNLQLLRDGKAILKGGKFYTKNNGKRKKF
jgi:hypothetical protein